MENKSYLTAISRRAPSVPLQALLDRALLKGRVLDYGCGKGFDAGYIDAECYDPFYWPAPVTGPFDTILCTYVLNVIETFEERWYILADIWALLAPGGTAYISVRNDKVNLNGYTQRGTFQTFVSLPYPILRDTGAQTYILSKP